MNKKTNTELLFNGYPSLVEEYSEMDKPQLLEQICAEVLDLHAMQDRVQVFMNECTPNMSKTTYTTGVIRDLISQKREMDFKSFSEDVLEGRTPEEVVSFLKEFITE